MTTIHNDDIFISMRLVLLIPTMYHTGVCNSVKANSQKSFVGHPTIRRAKKWVRLPTYARGRRIVYHRTFSLMYRRLTMLSEEAPGELPLFFGKKVVKTEYLTSTLFFFKQSIINQSINASTNQSINQTINHCS